jgi:hypothetical protein
MTGGRAAPPATARTWRIWVAGQQRLTERSGECSARREIEEVPRKRLCSSPSMERPIRTMGRDLAAVEGAAAGPTLRRLRARRRCTFAIPLKDLHRA